MSRSLAAVGIGILSFAGKAGLADVEIVTLVPNQNRAQRSGPVLERRSDEASERSCLHGRET